MSIPDVPYPLYPVVHTVPSFLVSLYIDILLLCLLHFLCLLLLVLFCLLYLLALVGRFHYIHKSILFRLILVLQSGFLLLLLFGCAIPPCTFTFTFMLPYTLFVSSEILYVLFLFLLLLFYFHLLLLILVSNDSYFKFIVTSLFNNVNFDSYLGLM